MYFIGIYLIFDESFSDWMTRGFTQYGKESLYKRYVNIIYIIKLWENSQWKERAPWELKGRQNSSVEYARLGLKSTGDCYDKIQY